MGWKLADPIIDVSLGNDPTTSMPEAPADGLIYNISDEVSITLLTRASERLGKSRITLCRDTSSKEIEGKYDLRGLCIWASVEAKSYLQECGYKPGVLLIARVKESESDDHYFVVITTGKKDTSTIVDLTWTQFNGSDKSTLPYWLAGTVKQLEQRVKGVLPKGVRKNLVGAWNAGISIVKNAGKSCG
jgi:hypothetical protein